MRGKLTPLMSQEVILRLEALHAIALEIDAFHSAVDDLHQRIPCLTDGDPARSRREVTRLDCLIHATSERITKLIAEFDAVLRLAAEGP